MNSQFLNNYDDKLDYNISKHKDNKIINTLIYNIESYFNNKLNKYVDEKILKEKMLEIFNTIGSGNVNRCVECGIDMGNCNGRQLCGKLTCHQY